jgi:hypothetical protein
MRMQLFCAAMTALTFLAGNFSIASEATSIAPPIMKMSSNASIFDASRSPSSVGADVQKELDRFLGVRAPASKRDWEVKPDGKISFDKEVWSATKDVEGSEVYTLKKTAARPNSGAKNEIEQKRTVIRNEDQTVRTVSEYRIENKKETYWFVFFLDQKLAAATTCSDKTPDGLRECVTAIPSVCKSLPKNRATEWTLPKAVIPDVDLVEKRALATVLTMRGEEHQVENMAKTGNLIGLKHKLQTTRGRLSTSPVKANDIKEVAQLCDRARFAFGELQ